MGEHYFSANPDTPAISTDLKIEIFDRQFDVVTMPGVFSHRGLDKGTAVLFRKVPFDSLPPTAHILDLGCGWGPISLALASTYPDASLFSIDINERALALCQQNLMKAGFHTITALEPVMYEKFVNDGIKLDLIWSNPPIRIGKTALHDLLLRWLNLLASDGVGYFVIQKNLGANSLSKWLEDQGFQVNKLGSAKGFQVIKVRHQ